MNPISNAGTKQQLAGLKAAALAFNVPIAAAVQAVADLKADEIALRARIASEWAAATKPVPDASGALADVLTADPAATLDPADVTAAAEAGGKAAADYAEAKVRIDALTAAVDALPGKIAAAEQAVDTLRGQQSRATLDLNAASYQALVAEFRKRFAVIRDEVLTPLLAIPPIGFVAGGAYLSRESLVQVRTYGVRTALDFEDERLLSFDDHAQAQARATADEVLADFLGSLPAA